MPPRWLSAAILLTWLASAGWLFRVEIWPSIEPNAPPPFTIDLVDEAQTGARPISWRVKRNGQDLFNAKTSVEHRSHENDFTLHAVFTPRSDARQSALPVKIDSMESSYRVTPDGRLLGLDVTLQFQMNLPLKVEACQAHLWGDVQKGQFEPHYELNWPLLGKRLSGALKPVAVAAYGSVVMPLHPVNRIGELRPGQEWRVPVFDPVADALASITGDVPRARFLKAKVRAKPETVIWNKVATPCLVIDYHEEVGYGEDKIDAETWVRQTDGLVLRQVAALSGDKWEMDRE